MPHGPANFRSTVVKPYYTEDQNDVSDNINADDSEKDAQVKISNPCVEQSEEQCRGYPKGSRHKLNTYIVGRNTENESASDVEREPEITWSLISEKKKSDFELSLELRRQSKIITPGQSFEASDKQEIDNLIEKEVFNFEKYDINKRGRTRIFKSRIVREVKGKTTDASYEKSRLLIQGYNDKGKEKTLTSSPTIQPVSQRLIISLTPTLQKEQMELWLRDISQAYTQ